MNTLIPIIERAANDGLVVTSETIAQGAGTEHRAVLQLITNNMADFEQFGQVAFEMRAGYNNSQVRVAMLNEQQATLLMTFQRNTAQVKAFKVALVKAFYDMAQQLTKPRELSRLELIDMARESELGRIEADKAREAAETKVKELEPKAEYVDTYVADNDSMLRRAVAGNLGIREKDLTDLLVYSEWIYRETQKRRNSKGEIVNENRYSPYANKKAYFYRQMEHQAPLFLGTLYHTLKVTPEGAQAIGRLVAKAAQEYGTVSLAIPHLKRRWEERHNLQVVPA